MAQDAFCDVFRVQYVIHTNSRGMSIHTLCGVSYVIMRIGTKILVLLEILFHSHGFLVRGSRGNWLDFSMRFQGFAVQTQTSEIGGLRGVQARCTCVSSQIFCGGSLDCRCCCSWGCFFCNCSRIAGVR